MSHNGSILSRKPKKTSGINQKGDAARGFTRKVTPHQIKNQKRVPFLTAFRARVVSFPVATANYFRVQLLARYNSPSQWHVSIISKSMFPEVKAFVSHRESIAKVSESQKGVSEGVAEFKPCLDPALFLAFRRPHSAMAFAHPSPPTSSTAPPRPHSYRLQAGL